MPIFLLLSVVHADEPQVAVIRSEAVQITTPTGDRTVTPLPPQTESPAFVVKSTVTHQVPFEQASEIPGWAPTKATINATVHLVEDPGLVDPAPPLPPLNVNDPAVQARLAELKTRFKPVNLPHIAFISATWYVREQVSQLIWWVDGEQMSCVTRLNMMNFGGFESFSVGERRYELIMGLGSEDSGRLAALFQSKGRPYQAPEFPAIPGGQDFVVTQGDATDPAKMQLALDLHALWNAKGPEMIAAGAAREQARKDREAYLKAHPPVLPDATIHFWKRDHAAPAAPAQLQQQSDR